MKELIHIEPRRIGNEGVQSVDARELHEFLENGDHFSTWIAERVIQYHFVEGQDFVTYSASAEKSGRGRPAKDFLLTIDMAKELSMVERNEKGRQARRYFIDCEKLAKSGVPKAVSRGVSLTSTIRAIELVSRMVGAMPGVREDDLLTVKLDMIERETGLPATEFRKALPSVEARAIKTLNATAIGTELGVSAIKANQIMESAGLQTHDGKGWRLTEIGTAHAKVVPFTRNGHTGTDIQWFESVLDFILQAERGAA
jgi:phage anti-repressor protein